MFKLCGIDICPNHVAIVADLYWLRANSSGKLYVGESPILPHKAVSSGSLLIEKICAHNHVLIVDALRKRSSRSTGKGNDGELAVVQEEAKIGTIAIKIAGNVAEVIYAHSNGGCAGKARNIYAMKDTGLHHERVLSTDPGLVKRTYDGSMRVDAMREGISRAGKPEMGELAAAKKKSRAMKSGTGAAKKKSDDGPIVIEVGG